MADSKKRKCLTAYDSSWEKDFLIGPASQNKHAFYCHPCQKVISCGQMGRGHVATHCDPKGDTVHNKNEKSINKSARIYQFLSLLHQQKIKPQSTQRLCIQISLYNIINHLQKLITYQK